MCLGRASAGGVVFVDGIEVAEEPAREAALGDDFSVSWSVGRRLMLPRSASRNAIVPSSAFFEEFLAGWDAAESSGEGVHARDGG